MSDQQIQVWHGYAFVWVCHLTLNRDSTGQPLTFMPQSLYPKATTKRLNLHGAGPFCHFTIPTSLTGEGVYIIARDEQPMYAGRCNDLVSRFNAGYGHISPANCYVRGQATNCKINNRILQETLASHALQLWFLPTPDSARIELELIAVLVPPWNGR